jgi:hypothetical protein
MRIANGILAVLLLLFVAVQWNDPDGLLWMFIYGAGVIWCVIAAFRLHLFASSRVFALFALTFAAALAGLAYYWPKTPQWWMQDVWWETETAREGMGMMILIIALVFAGISALRLRRRP